MLHYLYCKLPDEVAIATPNRCSRGDLSNACQAALQAEVDFLSDGLRKLQHSGTRSSLGISDFKEEGGSGDYDLRRVGEKFKRSQLEFVGEKNRSLEIPARVREKLTQLQVNTDTAVIHLLQQI